MSSFFGFFRLPNVMSIIFSKKIVLLWIFSFSLGMLFFMMAFFCGLLSRCISEEHTNVITLKSNQNSLVDLSRNKLESEKLLDDINKNLIFSKEPHQRDYNTIIQRTRQMLQSYPESEFTLTLLESIDRWHSLGFISDDQFSFFKKKLDDYKVQSKKSEILIGNIDNRYHKINKQQSSGSFQELIRACNDILATKDISQKLKCYTLILLARIYFTLENYQESEKYLDKILEEYTQSYLDFTHRKMILLETYKFKANIIFRKNGIDAASKIWKQYIDICAQKFDDIVSAYENMFLLLGLLKDNSEKTNKKKLLLEEFISSFPDSKAEQLLQSRLTLGYVILNEHTHVSGNMDAERAKELNKRYKTSAFEAEKIFKDALPLAQNTRFKEAFLKALNLVKEVQKDKPAQEASIDKSFLSETEIQPRKAKSMVVWVIVNLILMLGIICLVRMRLKQVLKKLLYKNQ
jgi:tetratricopeptide (TPR) repeat protein